LLDEPWLSIRWDRLHKCVHAEFKRFVTSAEFRGGTTKILDAIRARGATAVVSDNRRLEGLTNLDQLWLRDSWLPLAGAAGINRLAVVVARHGLSRVATEAITGKFERTEFRTHIFVSLPEALKWTSEL
jgi:hypothetical protein